MQGGDGEGVTPDRADEGVVITGTRNLTTEQKTRLISLLEDPIYELIPLKNALDETLHLPAGETTEQWRRDFVAELS